MAVVAPQNLSTCVFWLQVSAYIIVGVWNLCGNVFFYKFFIIVFSFFPAGLPSLFPLLGLSRQQLLLKSSFPFLFLPSIFQIFFRQQLLLRRFSSLSIYSLPLPGLLRLVFAVEKAPFPVSLLLPSSWLPSGSSCCWEGPFPFFSLLCLIPCPILFKTERFRPCLASLSWRPDAFSLVPLSSR